MIKLLVILTKFHHHGENSGYKQILKFLPPAIELGIDESQPKKTPRIKQKYQWLFEWDAKKLSKNVDIIHVFYGEDYFRFLPWLCTKTPIVATFHQPASTLKREVIKGDLRGRIGMITHLFTKKRFEKLAAAIVTEKSQKEVLSLVMDDSKIHVIPLGVHLSQFTEGFELLKSQGIAKRLNKVVTVGNWKRDWEFYKRVVAMSSLKKMNLEFHLVNRKFSEEEKEEFRQLGVHVHDDLSDMKLKEQLYTSSVMYLPVSEASGNNALFESLAIGTPVVISDVFNGDFFIEENCVRLSSRDNELAALEAIVSFCQNDEQSRAQILHLCKLVAQRYDWKDVAEKTLNIYNSILER
ncbi:MAG: glycosyltransferase [Flavobacteriales bacterium]